MQATYLAPGPSIHDLMFDNMTEEMIAFLKARLGGSQ
jgi:hypothetical protein